MNNTKGQSTQKQHLFNGSKTACNRTTTGINTNEFADFIWWAEKYPEICCKKCLNRYTEKYNRQKIK
jgi:hypothetical protein